MQPLEQFDRSISAFASGEADLTARMKHFKAPEFTKLSENFNAFVASLQPSFEVLVMLASVRPETTSACLLVLHRLMR